MSTPEPANEEKKTGECSKCMSEIPVEADRCPECGFEPKIGVLGGIGMWISLMLGSTSLVIALSALIVIADGFPVTDGLIAFGLFGFVSLFFFGFIYRKYQQGVSKPAQAANQSKNTAQQESKSVTESWREGKERGEGWKRTWVETMDSTPDWVFTAGIVVGIMLSLSVWVVGALELETAMLVSIFAGMLLLYTAVVTDVRRTNRLYGTGFRWYTYGIGAALPLVGWLFALGWVYRKRSVSLTA